MDASHPDPEGQIAAVRHVLADIDGVSDIPEAIVLNKADMADPEVIARIRLHESNVHVVSAHTGLGIEELLEYISEALPRPGIQIDVVVPYSRGELVNRIHLEGEIDSIEHVETGTAIKGRVDGELATELAPYTVK